MALTLPDALNRTQAKSVTVKFHQVVELIGFEKANELAIEKVALTQQIPKVRDPVEQQEQAENAVPRGLATFNRVKLLEAIVEGPPEE